MKNQKGSEKCHNSRHLSKHSVELLDNPRYPLPRSLTQIAFPPIVRVRGVIGYDFGTAHAFTSIGTQDGYRAVAIAVAEPEGRNANMEESQYAAHRVGHC